MRKLLGILVLGLLWFNSSFAAIVLSKYKYIKVLDGDELMDRAWLKQRNNSWKVHNFTNDLDKGSVSIANC